MCVSLRAYTAGLQGAPFTCSRTALPTGKALSVALLVPEPPGRPARPAGVPCGFCCEQKARVHGADELLKSHSRVYTTDLHLLV